LWDSAKDAIGSSTGRFGSRSDGVGNANFRTDEYCAADTSVRTARPINPFALPCRRINADQRLAQVWVAA
jgi:hypothetical protein